MGEYIFNICALICALIAGWRVLRQWKSFKKTKLPQLKNFSFGFLSISLAFSALSLPKLVLLGPFSVQVSFILTDLFFLIACSFLISATLSFSRKFSYLQKNIFWLFLFIGLIYTILKILLFVPAKPLFLNGKLIFFKNGNFLLHSLLWIPMASTAGFLGFHFLFETRKIRKEARRKSFLVGVGSIFVWVGGILFWYFKFFYLSPFLLDLSGIIVVLGFLLGVAADILFPPLQETWVKKIT